MRGYSQFCFWISTAFAKTLFPRTVSNREISYFFELLSILLKKSEDLGSSRDAVNAHAQEQNQAPSLTCRILKLSSSLLITVQFINDAVTTVACVANVSVRFSSLFSPREN